MRLDIRSSAGRTALLEREDSAPREWIQRTDLGCIAERGKRQSLTFTSWPVREGSSCADPGILRLSGDASYSVGANQNITMLGADITRTISRQIWEGDQHTFPLMTLKSGGKMSPSMRVTRRRPMPLPQIFASTRFPDVAQMMENALALLPEFPEMTELAQP